MTSTKVLLAPRTAVAALLLAGCAGAPANESVPDALNNDREGSTLGELFQVNDNPNVTLEVNRYLWAASLEVLDFLPVQSADPFSGIIVTGFGTPPGGGRAYRATILVQDPALDARSLNVALATRGGPADADTVRAVEDAILTRARQIRQRERGL